MADVAAYDPIFEAAGNEWNVDPQLLKAMAIQESGLNPRAVSKAGALGVMQIRPDTAKTLGITDPTDPVQSIYGAAKYMNRALDKEGSVEDALRNYHGGDGWRQAYGPESRGYVPAVTKHYQILGQFKTALADPDPSVRTDATAAAAAAPAAPTGAGKAMASADPLSLLPPAPKPTGGGAATAAPDDPLSLLPPAPKPTGAPPAAKDWRDDYPASDPSDIVPPADNPVSRIIGAGVEGAEAVPHIPRVPGDYITAPFYNPLIAGAETALRAGGGALRGLQQAAVELTPDIHLGSVPAISLGGNRSISGELTPGSLGREIAAGPEAFPTGFNALRVPGRPPIPEAPPPGPRFVQEFYGEGTPSNPLAAAPAAERPAFVPPGFNIPPRPVEPPAFIPPKEPSPVAGAAREAPATGPVATAAPVTEHTPWVSSTTADIQRVLQENAETGGPTSLGAMATPEQLAKMTPAQVKANRRVAELNQIVTPIEGEDTTEWVRGSTPTEAERTGTPTTSQKEVMTRQRNPDAFEGPNGQLTINDKARVNAFDETLLTDTQAADLKERQQKAASEAQGRILSTAKPVDLKPAADWIEAKLADPLIQEDKHVYNSLKGLRDQLYDADGNLKTDPRAAWGMHNNLRNKLLDAKDPFSANPSEKYAVTQTNEFKGLVDGALDKASDGQFRTHLDQQAEFLKSLNAWRLLNDFRYGPNKMINAKSGMINGNAFHRFVTDLAIRRGRPGIDAAMDVPDNVMQRLINIDQDLKRAGRIDLGKPRGSPTNLFFELAGALGITGAHALTAAMTAGTAFGGIANIGVQTGISAVQRRLGQRRINRLTEQALQPPPGGLTPPPGNPLQQ